MSQEELFEHACQLVSLALTIMVNEPHTNFK